MLSDQNKAVIPHEAHTFCQPMSVPHQVWMLRFCDQDMGDMFWEGPDAREQAIDAWNRYNVAWNCYLFATHDARQEGRQSAGERVKVVRQKIGEAYRQSTKEAMKRVLGEAADICDALLSPQAAPVEQGEASGPRLVNAPSSDEPIRCPDCNALIHDWVHGLEHVCGVGDPRDPANEQKDGAS